LIPAGVTGIFH